MAFRTDRKDNEMRQIKFIKNFIENSYSSILIESGKTKVICTASVNTDIPPCIDKEKSGWLSAEYNMLPGSTNIRKARSTIKPDGRSIEIQRLIARVLRQAVDLTKIKGYSIIIDCDVIQADGGTRTASINGGYLALNYAVKRMINEGLIHENPLTAKIASISAGILQNNILLDLNYKEDSKADVDFNVVMNDKLKLIEIQGTGERNDFSIEQLSTLVEFCRAGIEKIFNEMDCILKN